MHMQVGRVAAAVVVIGAVVSGCGGPSQAGTAVFVGEEAVPLERVQTQLDAALAKDDQIAQIKAQGGTTADLARSVVTDVICTTCSPGARLQEGIVVTDAQVDEQISQNGGPDALLDGSLNDLHALREQVRDKLIAAQLALRQVPGLEVTVDLVACHVPRRRAGQGGGARRGRPGGRRTRLEPPDRGAVASPCRPSTRRGRGDAVLFALPVGSVVAFRPGRAAERQLDRHQGHRQAHRRPDRPGGAQRAQPGPAHRDRASDCCSRWPRRSASASTRATGCGTRCSCVSSRRTSRWA